MTKSELIERVAQRQTQLAYRDIELAVKTILELMAQRLAGGERIEIRGFGSFSLHYRPGRVGRNPKPVIRFLCLKNTFHTSSRVKSCANVLTKLIAIRGHEVSGRRFGVSTGLRESAGARVVDVFGSYGCTGPQFRGHACGPCGARAIQIGGRVGSVSSDPHCRLMSGLEQCSSKAPRGLAPPRGIRWNLRFGCSFPLLH